MLVKSFAKEKIMEIALNKCKLKEQKQSLMQKLEDLKNLSKQRIFPNIFLQNKISDE